MSIIVSVNSRSLADHPRSDWSELILPDMEGSQLPGQSGQVKYTATLDIGKRRGSVVLGLIESQKTAGFC